MRKVIIKEEVLGGYKVICGSGEDALHNTYFHHKELGDALQQAHDYMYCEPKVEKRHVSVVEVDDGLYDLRCWRGKNTEYDLVYHRISLISAQAIAETYLLKKEVREDEKQESNNRGG